MDYEFVFLEIYNWGIMLIQNARSAWDYMTTPIIDLSSIGLGTYSIATVIFSSTAFTFFAAWCIKQFINPWWD